MIPKEIIQKIRRIQLRTSHRVDEMFAGGWHSAFKGRGIEFEEVRPYQVGDDVRAIDWNVTARNSQPFVKLFREERELSVILLVDISRSQGFGTNEQTKRELVTEICATLAMSAIRNNDRVGLTLFSSDIELSLPPKTGSKHVLRIIRELLYSEPVGSGTDLANALDFLNQTVKRKSVVFLVSDFFGDRFERSLRIATRRHDVIPIVVYDDRESKMPNVGLVRLRDVETGRLMTLDTGSARIRRLYEQGFQKRTAERTENFRRLRLNPLFLETGKDFVEPMRAYFHQREMAR